jgi:cell division protein FtsL
LQRKSLTTLQRYGISSNLASVYLKKLQVMEKKKQNLIDILTGGEERFSKREWLLYGIIYPAAIVAVCIVSSLIWQL